MNELVVYENGKLIIDLDYAEEYAKVLKLQKALELKTKEVNQRVKEIMEENGIDTLSANGLIYSYRKPTTRTTLDSKKLKEDMPDIYEEYSKISPVVSSVSVKVLD